VKIQGYEVRKGLGMVSLNAIKAQQRLAKGLKLHQNLITTLPGIWGANGKATQSLMIQQVPD
jgi:hypothetical protein